MTTSTGTTSTSLPDADLGSIKGLIRDLRGKKHHPGVVAVAAVPVWSGTDEITLDGQRVRIAAARSVLAIRDAIRSRPDTDWLVVLTDQPSSSVPSGVAEHLVTNRLLNLDPFPLLRTAFAASEQEFGLLGDKNSIARAMLRELGERPTPAPGGVLTNDHVFAELARTRFGLDPVDFTPHHVAVWSVNPIGTQKYSSWSATADPVLVDQFLDWLSRRLGDLGPVLITTWRVQGPAQIVPLGLIAGLTAGAAVAADDSADVVTRVRTRLEMKIGNAVLAENQLASWSAVAGLAVAAAPDPSSALTAAQAWVPDLQAERLVVRSDMLPSALALRVTAFARELAGASTGRTSDLAGVENAWAAVRAHRDAQVDTAKAPRDVRVGAAALRLLRRLAMPWPQPETLVDWLNEYRDDLSWVDGVVNNAYIGAGDPQLAEATHVLVDAARASRAHLDRGFAAVLATAGTERHTGAGTPLYIEDVLDRVIVPLTARPHGATGGALGLSEPARSPVLLVVADGMDVATANDVVADAGRHRPQWQDCVPRDGRPLTTLAVLPTVTKFSRCSLLTGALAAGSQDRERAGFADWLQRHGLRGNGQVLFHKADLDAVSKGHSLAADVRQAVQDTERRTVVACVLNDIDDALDRSDPIGTSWTVESFKHLDALLTEAASVGRTVVLVSDHGHVVERREQPSVQRGDQISARYRAATSGEQAGADEVIVQGERVRTEDHRAVLAVDEQLRYTGLKAGYHGGAALAEACVAVSILVHGAIPTHLELESSPGTPPLWWVLEDVASRGERSDVLDTARTGTPSKPSKPQPSKPKPSKTKPVTTTKAAAATQDSLFDFGSSADASASTQEAADTGVDVYDEVGKLLASDLFAGQFKLYGRTLKRTAIAALLRDAIAGNGLVPLTTVAATFEVKPTQARSVIAWLSQILNIDGVMVIAAQGDEVAVATGLLFEQFGVAG